MTDVPAVAEGAGIKTAKGNLADDATTYMPGVRSTCAGPELALTRAKGWGGVSIALRALAGLYPLPSPSDSGHPWPRLSRRRCRA